MFVVADNQPFGWMEQLVFPRAGHTDVARGPDSVAP